MLFNFFINIGFHNEKRYFHWLSNKGLNGTVKKFIKSI